MRWWVGRLVGGWAGWLVGGQVGWWGVGWLVGSGLVGGEWVGWWVGWNTFLVHVNSAVWALHRGSMSGPCDACLKQMLVDINPLNLIAAPVCPKFQNTVQYEVSPSDVVIQLCCTMYFSDIMLHHFQFYKVMWTKLYYWFVVINQLLRKKAKM